MDTESTQRSEVNTVRGGSMNVLKPLQVTYRDAILLIVGGVPRDELQVLAYFHPDDRPAAARWLNVLVAEGALRRSGAQIRRDDRTD